MPLRGIDACDRERSAPLRLGARLLDDVGELVPESAASVYAVRRVAANGKHSVRADRVRACVHRISRTGRLTVAVHADVAEVVSEAVPRGTVYPAGERDTGACQHIVNNLRCGRPEQV